MLPLGAALAAAAVGFGATLFMDLWALVMQRAFGMRPPDYRLVGRWICHMPDGRFTHANITDAAPRRFELAVGWSAHYVIGVSYALAFIALVTGGWLAAPRLLPALLFGVGTVLVPFLVMQPAFGLGIAAAQAPSPSAARLRSLMAHLSFGFGLYLIARCLAELG